MPEALRDFVASGLAPFKFVVQGVAELDQVEALEEEFGLRPIWVMPEGATMDAVVAGMRACVAPAAARGWRLGTRMHVLLWGDERGK